MAIQIQSHRQSFPLTTEPNDKNESTIERTGRNTTKVGCFTRLTRQDKHLEEDMFLNWKKRKIDSIVERDKRRVGEKNGLQKVIREAQRKINV